MNHAVNAFKLARKVKNVWYFFLQEAAGMEIETNYDDFVNVDGTQVNPLNFAPIVHKNESKKIVDSKIPVSELHHASTESCEY